MKENFFDTAIIGGGASGLAGAIMLGQRTAHNPKYKIVVLEKQNRCGKKLLATGGGRCNLSNAYVNPEFYYGDKNLINSVLERFGVNEVKSFFEDLGLLLREDEAGRLYPYSNKSANVLECLCTACERLNIPILTECGVTDIFPRKNGFTLITQQGEINAKNVVLTCGTGATTQLGGTQNGFEFFQKLGIDYKKPLPALTAVQTVQHYALKGVRAKGTVRLKADNKTIAQSEGEIQFTDDGLSGICVFDLSRKVSEFLETKMIDGVRYKQIVLAVDLFPSYSFSELCAYLNR